MQTVQNFRFIPLLGQGYFSNQIVEDTNIAQLGTRRFHEEKTWL